MKDIVMVYKTHVDYQKVEVIVSFLRSTGIEIIRSAKEMIEEYFNETPEFADLPEELS